MDLVTALRELIERHPPAGIDDAIVAMMTRPDMTPGLEEIACPTLLVVGEEDGLTPVELHRRMREAIAGSTLEIIAGAGHVPNLEQPETFNKVLRTFLDALR
jgi:non-heme chloroperoxidase